jgi:outer membrane protein TolC
MFRFTLVFVVLLTAGCISLDPNYAHPAAPSLAKQKSLNIAMKSYQAGVGDYLSVLAAQRTLWSAQTTLISLQQTDLENRITLWQSLGGGAS